MDLIIYDINGSNFILNYYMCKHMYANKYCRQFGTVVGAVEREADVS